MQSDDLSGVFSGTEQLAFDLRWSDQENLSINSAKATKVTDSPPAYAIFGNDMTSGIQRYGVKVIKQVDSIQVGVLVNPRTPSRPCWADTLRTPAVMIGKGGSVYRTGRLGTKMVEYLGPDLKKTMGKSYPPKFGEGDTVNLELNKDTREVKMWINDKAPFTIGGIDPAAKFFVNMEGEQSAIEIVRIN